MSMHISIDASTGRHVIASPRRKALQFMGNSKIQDYANTAWAFAVVHLMNATLSEFLARAVEQRMGECNA